jgi:hypothetical protein
VAAAVGVGLVVVGGGAAAATWSSTFTGIFGAGGQSENDTTEFLDVSAPDFAAVALQLGADIPFPPGDSAAAYVPIVFGSDGLVQVSGVRMTLALDAVCAWSGVWLQATAAGDAAQSHAAATVLGEAASWPAIADHDGGGVVVSLQRVADAAAAGDDGPVREHWEANCTSLPTAWATS